MSTQRLDLPLAFHRNFSSRAPAITSASIPGERPSILKQNIRVAPHPSQRFLERGKSLKRFAEQGTREEFHTAKRNRKTDIGIAISPSSTPSTDPCKLTETSKETPEQYPKSSFSSEGEFRDGSAIPVGQSTGGDDEDSSHHARDFDILSLLISCVEAFNSLDVILVDRFMARLGTLASPSAATPTSRLLAYFTEALALRAAATWPRFFRISVPDRIEEDDATAFRLLNEVTPIPKFIHFSSNEILLRAFEGKDAIHVIDLDIKQGLQWPSFLQSLASRTHPPRHVRVTGIGESKQEINETGYRLAGLAESLNLTFRFHPVVERLEALRLWMLHVKERETVAVNCMLQLLTLKAGALTDLLSLIQATSPTVVVLAEQESRFQRSNFIARVSTSLKYYSAIFDMLHSALPPESSIRTKIEEMFGREITKMIACDETRMDFEERRRAMQARGFRSVWLDERVFLQSEMLLKMYSCEKYRVEKEEDDGTSVAVTLSWLDQSLYTVSAWVPVDTAARWSSWSSFPA